MVQAVGHDYINKSIVYGGSVSTRASICLHNGGARLEILCVCSFGLQDLSSGPRTCMVT